MKPTTNDTLNHTDHHFGHEHMVKMTPEAVGITVIPKGS